MTLARTTARPEFATAEVARFDASGRPGYAWAHPQERRWAAAYGEADRREGGSLRAVIGALDAPRDLPDGMPGPWFGAVAFDGRAWDGFAPLRFTLPALLTWSDGARHHAAAFGAGAERRLGELRRRLDRPSEAVSVREITGVTILERDAKSLTVRDARSHAAVRRLRQPGERERWNALVSRALTAITAGALDKVVAARAVDVESATRIDADALVAALERRHPACRAFLIRGDDGAAFVGATPELLCRVDGGLVRTEALAGSAAPADAATLPGSRKDLREHRWVVDHIAGALESVARDIRKPPEPALRTLANVVHLHTPITARLAPGRGVADVVAALHPTPAVLGVPAPAARRFLEEHEALERGLYAGIVGWVGAERAELAVALRCALIRGNRARLFVGAGLVEGSSAEREWEETELKAAALLDALGVQP